MTPTQAEINGGWLIVTNGTREQATGRPSSPSDKLTEEQCWYLAWTHVRSLIANRRSYLERGLRPPTHGGSLEQLLERLQEIVTYCTQRGWMEPG